MNCLACVCCVTDYYCQNMYCTKFNTHVYPGFVCPLAAQYYDSVVDEEEEEDDGQ